MSLVQTDYYCVDRNKHLNLLLHFFTQTANNNAPKLVNITESHHVTFTNTITGQTHCVLQ